MISHGEHICFSCISQSGSHFTFHSGQEIGETVSSFEFDHCIAVSMAGCIRASDYQSRRMFDLTSCARMQVANWVHRVKEHIHHVAFGSSNSSRDHHRHDETDEWHLTAANESREA